LSVAEIDYQLRKYLLNPANKHHLLKMFEMVFKKIGKNQQ
jgi:YesN/AraC family two-component response regulator